MYVLTYTLFWFFLCLLIGYLSYKYGWAKRNGEKNNYVHFQAMNFEFLYNKECAKNGVVKSDLCYYMKQVEAYKKIMSEGNKIIQKLRDENASLLESVNIKNAALEAKMPSFELHPTGQELITDHVHNTCEKVA